MSDAIAPALTREEWASIPAEWESDRERYGPLRGIGIGYTNGDLHTGALSNPYTPEQMLALVNHALPDDHPLKITRADVALVERAGNEEVKWASDAASETERVAMIDKGFALIRLAAKLAALLPPDA